MRARLTAVALALVLAPALLWGAPRGSEPRHEPGKVPELPSHVRRVEPALVGIHVEVPRDRPSALTLGAERWGSGVIFDGAAGYALTVSYVLLDAETVEVTLRDGRKVSARLVGLDLEVGLGVVKLSGAGPWPAATFGDSSRVAAGDLAGTAGIAEDGGLVATSGRIDSTGPFTAAWEYMLDRAFVVSPFNAAFGGGALVDGEGRLIGITSLRLGPPPHVNLAIPIEKFLPGKDELVAKGRVASRPVRPWLGVYTATREGGGVVVSGVAPFGPARAAGFRPGDIIVRLNGEPVQRQEDFYARLWQGAVGREVHVVVERDSALHDITVKPQDRYRVYRTSGK